MARWSELPERPGADIALRGKNAAYLFRRGQMVRKLPIDEVVDLLVHEVEHLAEEMDGEG